MKKERFEQIAMDYLRGTTDVKEKTAFETFLSENPKYDEEFRKLKSIWAQIDMISVPEPSEKMDERFFAQLHLKTAEGERSSNWLNTIFQTLTPLMKPQLAYGLLVLSVGLTLGYFLNSGSMDQNLDSTIASNQETKEVREKLVLTLLEQPSANKRLQGVSEANKIEKVDEKVIAALLKTLNSDPNVNVRLAAIESLTNYVENAMVRQGLVQSIPHQESPIVQVTLANLMTALQEKKSIEPFRKLLEEKNLDTTVKRKLEQTIESII